MPFIIPFVCKKYSPYKYRNKGENNIKKIAKYFNHLKENENMRPFKNPYNQLSSS